MSRSMDWAGGRFLTFGAPQIFEQGTNQDGSESTVASWWMLYPRGLPDPSNENTPNAPDDTLIRSITHFSIWRNINPEGAPQQTNNNQVALGLIAFDAISPELLDGQLTVGEAPNPINPGYDWIWRSVVSFNVANYFSSTPSSFDERISKAQRKLPKSRGVLLCIGSYTEAGDTLLRWIVDCRHLVKKPR